MRTLRLLFKSYLFQTIYIVLWTVKSFHSLVNIYHNSKTFHSLRMKGFGEEATVYSLLAVLFGVSPQNKKVHLVLPNFISKLLISIL